MAWKIYSSSGHQWPGQFKTKIAAQIYWKRWIRHKDEWKEPIYVETEKGRKK